MSGSEKLVIKLDYDKPVGLSPHECRYAAHAVQLDATADVGRTFRVVQVRFRKQCRVVPRCVWSHAELCQVRALRVELG